MTEEKKFCRICKNLGIDCEAGTFYCSLSHRPDKLPNTLKCDEFILCDLIARLEQENKELRKANEISIEKVTVTAEAKRLQELEQENKSNKELLIIAQNEAMEAQYDREKYKNALEEIKEYVTRHPAPRKDRVMNTINEVLG